mmetsp:Transcript_60371/g.112027  ORF Transcript_60371/g.112027 Transcript_60371/m.112027 type:complete len:87 (-) Transcript_60371:6-266(-)
MASTCLTRHHCEQMSARLEVHQTLGHRPSVEKASQRSDDPSLTGDTTHCEGVVPACCLHHEHSTVDPQLCAVIGPAPFGVSSMPDM